ncbi:hypothetical protein TGP89_272530 [Toxoplasma gondii p89]|uniref:Uncharacterized protein n=1 Tax=Toxoplasma gondii p89 TaxID=943119 RepID=A0A086L566_TOXGO|nr:hypothetical protein TGP89_272530 [Toxoplasma gondii p89]
MEEEDVDDTCFPSDDHGRVFLRIRDWIENHKRGISSALYVAAGLSLWVLKRSIQDYRVNRIRRVEDVPEALFKHQAKLSGVVASVDISSGVLYFYHVPLLHRILRCFLPIPLLVPVVSSVKRATDSSGDAGSASLTKLTTTAPLASALSSLLPLRLHSVDTVPLRKANGPLVVQGLERGQRAKQVSSSAQEAGCDRERGGNAFEERHGDFYGDNCRSDDPVVHALQTFLEAEILQQQVTVTLVGRDVTPREVERSTGAHERGSGSGGREPTRHEQRGGKVGAWGDKQSTHSGGEERGDEGNVEKKAPWFTCFRFWSRRTRHDDLIPPSPLRVRLQFAKKNIFDLRRYDLEEELLCRGLAVVAYEKLREEENDMTAKAGLSSLLPFRRWRTKKRIKKLEALQTKARELDRGIWATGSEEGDAHGETQNPAGTCAAVPSSLGQERRENRKARHLFVSAPLSFFSNCRRCSFCSSSRALSSSFSSWPSLWSASSWSESSSSPCCVSPDATLPLFLEESPAGRSNRFYLKAGYMLNANQRLRAAAVCQQHVVRAKQPPALPEQQGQQYLVRCTSFPLRPPPLFSSSRSSFLLPRLFSSRPSFCLHRSVVSPFPYFEKSMRSLGKDRFSRGLACSFPFFRGVSQWCATSNK